MKNIVILLFEELFLSFKLSLKFYKKYEKYIGIQN